jgi:hypothetical protein
MWRIATKDELAIGRVSRLKTTKWLREQLAIEKDAEAKAILQDSLKQLELQAAEL